VNSKRTSLRSRDVMARSLLKRVDDRRDQVTKQYMPPRKLDLIEELTQAPTMPLLHRDYPKTRTIGMVQPRRTRRSATSMDDGPPGIKSLRSHSRSGSGHGIRLKPIRNVAQTHPPMQSGGPQLLQGVTRPPDFYKKLSTVDPAFLAQVHKNLQEKVYTRFTGARDAFRRFDLDHSGAIDYREFKQVMRDMELIRADTNEHQIEALFHLCDESGQGQISYQDFCKWIKTPDRHENLMIQREKPYRGQHGGMTFGQRSDWIRALGVMCE